MAGAEPGWGQLTLYAPLDWEGLQLGGVICAALLCIAGILFALSEQWDWQGWGGGGERVGRGCLRLPRLFALAVSSFTGGKCKCKQDHKHR